MQEEKCNGEKRNGMRNICKLSGKTRAARIRMCSILNVVSCKEETQLVVH